MASLVFDSLSSSCTKKNEVPKPRPAPTSRDVSLPRNPPPEALAGEVEVAAGGEGGAVDRRLRSGEETRLSMVRLMEEVRALWTYCTKNGVAGPEHNLARSQAPGHLAD